MNLDNIADRLYSWSEGKRVSPETVQIYPTNLCNLKCIFCVQRLKLYNLKDEVKRNRWLKIIKEICEMDVREILISGGGEPLCIPKTLMEMMKLIKEHKIEGRLITNGTLWTSEMIENTIKIGWDHVTFSLDAPDAETHDYLRDVKGAYQKIINNIRTFQEMKKKLKTELPMLEFTTVLNKYNFRKIPELIELAHSLDIKNVNVEPICVNNPTVKRIKLNENERKMFINKILSVAEKLSRNYNISNNFNTLRKAKFIEKTGELKKIILEKSSNDFLDLPCYEPWLWPKIEASGEVWPCSTTFLPENIKEKSFKEIWYGEKFKNFRKRIINKRLPKSCSNCVLTHVQVNREISERLKTYIS